MPTADQFAIGSLLLVVVVALSMWYFGTRSIKAVEKEGATTTADDIRRLYGSMLNSGEFLWGVWLGRTELDKKRLRVRNHRDEEVTVIHDPALPIASSLHYFDWQQARYGANPESLLGPTMAYRKEGNSRVLYTSLRKWLKIRIHHGETGVELCTVHLGTVFSNYSRVMRGDVEIGRIISQDQRDYYSPILCVQPGTLSELEQLIVLMALM